jgi:hypothetical protein
MRCIKRILIMAAVLASGRGCSPGNVDLDRYPSITISNDHVEMKVFLPDPEKGIYRATRFDWSGVIGSAKYGGHEYYGYWKQTQDPMIHEDLTGPVEGYIEPGPGYREAAPGEGFIRIGVGIIEKEEEEEYTWSKTYKIMDHGSWKVQNGADWVKFTQEINSDFGYGYVYMKTIRLKDDGFLISHRLVNTGEEPIETDQFNHNFLMIDGQESGPAFTINFPYTVSTESDLKDLMEIRDKELRFLKELDQETIWLRIHGYSSDPQDHRVTVQNRETGAGVTWTVDRPLYDMVFWACASTLSPENSVWISVNPGQEESWTAEYTFFVDQSFR